MFTPSQDQKIGIGLEFGGLLVVAGFGLYSGLHHAGILIAIGLGAVAIVCGKKLRAGSVQL